LLLVLLLLLQVHRLKLAEQALLDYQAQKDQVSQLKQSNQDLQQQLAAVQAAQAAAEGAAQECRRQLTAAGAEKAVLMDRIRQLANRASIAECATHRSRSGDSSSGGSSADGGQQQHSQQEQQQLLAAVAELNEQVAALRGQLTEAESKEERLQVTNAALQERLSRLQVRHCS
jgi:septal ring factor EnvC (AmiA/AmiB activator)